jgi:hypothetical protein
MCLNRKQADLVMAQLLCEIIEAAVIPPTPDECSEIFQDDFEDGPEGLELLQPPWYHTGDTFLYSSGKAVEDPGGDGSTAYANTFDFADGYVQAECWGTNLHGLYFRADPNVGLSTYLLRIDESTGQVDLLRGATLIGTATVTWVSGAVLRLDGVGLKLTVTYDGTVVMVVNDDAGSGKTAAGKAGIVGGEDLSAIFDNFECCSVD